MGNMLCRPTTASPGLSVATRAPYLTDLPLETLTEIASHLGRQDIKALRSTCKHLDTLLLDTFGKLYFSSVYLLPTSYSLDIFAEISKSKRLSCYVRELCICSSFHQGARTLYKIPPGDSSAYRLRYLDNDELPFPEDWAERRAVNESVLLVRGGSFGKKLAIVLQNLNVKRIEIHAWPKMPQSKQSTVPGLWWLKQLTGHDPFLCVSSEFLPCWEYGDIDMVTCITNNILSAISETQIRVSGLVLDKIELDNLVLDSTLLLSYRLESLEDLDISIGVSDYETKALLLEQGHIDLFTMINNLPRLTHLSLSNLPYKNEKEHLSLNDLVSHLRPKNLHSLSLNVIDSACPNLYTFLSSLQTPLHTLHLTFRTYKHLSDKLWRDLFSSLQNLMSSLRFEDLQVWVGKEGYRAHGNIGIGEMLNWLAEHVQKHWNEDEDRGVEDVFTWYGDEEIDLDLKPRSRGFCISKAGDKEV